MATKNPRLNIVLEPALIKGVAQLAKARGISLSTMARDLIKESLETYEDVRLDRLEALVDQFFLRRRAGLIKKTTAGVDTEILERGFHVRETDIQCPHPRQIRCHPVLLDFAADGNHLGNAG